VIELFDHRPVQTEVACDVATAITSHRRATDSLAGASPGLDRVREHTQVADASLFEIINRGGEPANHPCRWAKNQKKGALPSAPFLSAPNYLT
jgi:hypothetical protein